MTDRSIATQNTWSRDPYGVSTQSQANVWSNSLATSLSPPGATIFRGPLTAFRNPAINPFVGLFSQMDMGSAKDLLQTNPRPFGITDFPNPRGYTYPSDLRSFTQSPVPPNPVSLLSVNNEYDWPNPILNKYSPPAQSTGVSLGLTAVQSSLLFNQVYDNPVRKSWDGNLYSFIQNIAPTNPIPANVTNWPNPLGYQHPSSNRTWTALGFNQLQAGLTQVPAEANYDQPNPRGYVHPSDLRTFTQGTNQSLKGLTPVPLIPFDWPNPTVAKWTPAPVVFTNALQVLGLAPPFFQTDFPNPVLGKTPIDRLSFSNNSGLLQGFNSAPIAQYDWPNPRGYTYPSDLRTFWQGIIAAEDTPPNNQYNWPNPTLGRWSPGNLTFISGTSRELQAVVNTPAPTTYDRPNPPGYIPVIDIRTGQSYSIPLTLLTFVPPVSTGQHNRYFFADMGRMMSNM